MIEIIVLILGAVVSASIGLLVFVRNPKNIVNRIYALLTLTLIFFPIANYLSLQTVDRLFFVRAVIFLTTIAVACLYYLVFWLNNQKGFFSPLQQAGVYYTIAVAIISWTPLVFTGLTEGPNPIPISGPLAIFFFAQLLIFPANALLLLITRAHRTRGLQHQQYIYMLIGIMPILFLAPITSFIMPIVLGNASLIFLSPLYALFFVAVTGYGIVRYRLFDVRLVVVRAIVYVFSLATLFSIFMILGLVSLQIFFSGAHTNTPLMVTVTYAILAVLTAFLLQPIKKVFDRATNSLFYRDAYDSQLFFNDLNQILVSTIDLDKLLSRATRHIEQTIKPSFCSIALQERNVSLSIGDAKKIISDEDLKVIHEYFRKHHILVAITDFLLHEDVKLANTLRKNGVGLVARLGDVDKPQGYLIMGEKKSGLLYSSQDNKVIEAATNGLTVAIQNAMRFEEIERFSETLQEKVEDATKQLRRQNERLKVLDQTKDDFVGMASHQLRTPLTSVKGYVSMVLEEDAGKVTPLQRKLLNQAFVSAQRMVYLIADLLNVSRLRTGKFGLETTSTNLASVVASEVEQLKETAKARDLTLTFQRPEHFPNYMLDETKLRQVIMNFIDNAIYYTRAGGKISIILTDQPESVQFTVTDTGIGVPKADQPHMFTKYFRARNAQTARPDGTGLGLFMAKKVVIAHGGAIIFKSRPGKGSTFGFTLPKRALELPAEKAKPQTTVKPPPQAKS